MTRPSLADIDKSAAAATEGPWDVIGGGEYVSGPDIVVAPDDGGVTPADAAFIAVARTAIPALSAAIRDVLTLHTSDWSCGNPAHTNPDVGCPECGAYCAECWQSWPCATTRAITAAQRLARD